MDLILPSIRKALISKDQVHRFLTLRGDFSKKIETSFWTWICTPNFLKNVLNVQVIYTSPPILGIQNQKNKEKKL